MTLTVSLVGSRHSNARGLKKLFALKEYGLVTNLVHTRIAFGVWHLQFDVEKR